MSCQLLFHSITIFQALVVQKHVFKIITWMKQAFYKNKNNLVDQEGGEREQELRHPQRLLQRVQRGPGDIPTQDHQTQEVSTVSLICAPLLYSALSL